MTSKPTLSVGRGYLKPRRRYRRRPWRAELPRLDRQVMPGHFQPPALTTCISPRRLAAIVVVGIVLWVGIFWLALAVLA